MTGKEFRKWRRSEDITQDKVAEYCEVHKSTISRWENKLVGINEQTYLKVLEFVSQI